MVSDLEDKSTALKEMAKDYKTDARNLRKATGWTRKKKYMVGVGSAGIGALVYMGFRYFFK